MKRLENLQSAADEMLGGLTAGSRLKHKILQMSRGRHPVYKNRYRLAAVCAALIVLAATSSVFLGRFPGKDADTMINTVAAGAPELNGSTQVALLDIPQGSITFSDQAGTPSYRGIWAAGTGGNFPLLRAEGRYYRLLTNPTAIDDTLLGEKLGTVDVFTSEPALASADGIISNIVQGGETVYAVRSMHGAMAAARVDGMMRVFQRVSYANSARIGGESLADTLRAESVSGLELSGVGTVGDKATASSLLGILLESAVFSRSSSSETGQALLIRLSSGLVLQMSVKNDSVMACGTWDCPEFFEAFRKAAD